MLKRCEIDPKKIWAWLFFAVFLFVPLCIIHESALYAAVVIALLYFLSRKLELPRFPIVLFVVALALRAAAVFLVPTPAESDFAMLLNAARQMNSGDRSYLDGFYFQYWGYQLGFVSFEALLLKLGDSVVVLKLFNCLVGAGTTVLIYLLARELTSKRAAQVVGVFYCFSPMGVFYCAVLSNQIFPAFLLLGGIYFLVGERFRAASWLRFAVFGLLLSLANLLRPESIIPLTATGISVVLLLRKDNWKQRALCVAAMLGVYFGMNALLGLIYTKTGLAPNGLVNQAPYWKFVLGFNHDTGGGYSEADTVLLSDPNAAWAVVSERLHVSLLQMYHLFERKISVFWGNSALGWVFDPFKKTGLPVLGNAQRTASVVTIIHGINFWFHFAAYALTLLGVVRLIRTDRLRLLALLLMNILFVTFGIYLLIEIQPRYAFVAQAVCFVLAAPGLELLWARRDGKEKTKQMTIPAGSGMEENYNG